MDKGLNEFLARSGWGQNPETGIIVRAANQERDWQEDQFLTDFGLEYYNQEEAFVHQELAPDQNVKNDTGKYNVYRNREQMSQSVDPRVAPGDRPKQIQLGHNEATYATETLALEAVLTSKARQNTNKEDLAQRERRIVRMVMNVLRLYLETDVKTQALNTSVVPNGPASVKLDDTSSDFLAECLAVKQTMRPKGVPAPNTMVVMPQVVPKATLHPQIIELMKRQYGGDIVENTDLPPVIAGMRVKVPGALVDTANPAQTSNVVDVWNEDSILFAYVNPDAGTEDMTFMSTFAANVSEITQKILVQVVRDEHTRNWYYKVWMERKSTVVAPEAGFILTDVLT